MQAENLEASTPVVVLPTWAKRGFGSLPRCSLDDVKGELAVAQVTVIFEGLNFAYRGKRRDPGLGCPTAWLCATSRRVRLRLHFCRRISHVWRMDSRSVAIPPPFGGRTGPADGPRR